METCFIHLCRNRWTLHFVALNAQQCFRPLRFFQFSVALYPQAIRSERRMPCGPVSRNTVIISLILSWRVRRSAGMKNKKSEERQKRSRTATVERRMVSFRPGGGGADRCSGAWKGCCAGDWERGEAWCQGDLWKCRRRPADSAAIVPCFEASLRGYTEALCCSGLPSLSRFLLRASPSAPLEGSLGVGLWRSAWSSSSGALPLFPPSDPVEL